MNISINTNNNEKLPLVYIDKNNKLQREEGNKSFSGRVGRIFSSKNYDIIDIWLNTITSPEKTPDAPQNKEFIQNKVAKKFHRDFLPRTVENLSKILTSDATTAKKITRLIQLLRKEGTLLGNALEQIHQHLSPVDDKHKENQQIITRALLNWKAETEWEILKLPPKLYTDHHSEAIFLYKTGLLRTIVGLQHSSSNGKESHAIKEENGHLTIKMDGKWTSVSEISKKLGWNEKLKTLYTKGNKATKWNYYDNGLVSIDRFYRADKKKEENQRDIPLQKIAQLSKEDFDAIANNANLFIFDKDKPKKKTTSEMANQMMGKTAAKIQTKSVTKFDKDEKKVEEKYIIQIVTYPRPIETDPLFKNFEAQKAVECGIRFINPKGEVYSTGMASMEGSLVSDRADKEFLGETKRQLINGYTNEFQPHDGRLITNLSISESMASKITQKWVELRESQKVLNGHDFESELLTSIGIKLNMKINPKEVIYRSLPNLEDLPRFGKPLSILKGRVVLIGNSISKALLRTAEKLPPIVTKQIGLFIYELIDTAKTIYEGIFDVLLTILFSGNVADIKQVKSYGNTINQMASTDYKMSHLPILIHWQLEQTGTQFYDYSGVPTMNLVPEKEVSEKTQEKIKYLKEQYQYSTPPTSEK